MPGYKAHCVIGVVATAPLTAGSYAASYLLTKSASEATSLALIFSASHVFGTFYLSPDLDLDSSAYKVWGTFRFLWSPYKSLVKHRSPLSHSIIGGVFRMLYLTIALLFLSFILLYLLQSLEDIFQFTGATKAFMHILDALVYIAISKPIILAPILLGAASSSWVHILADSVWSLRPRSMRRPSRRANRSGREW